jgi:NAD+ kinase
MSKAKVAAIAHRHKPRALALLKELRAWAAQRDFEVLSNLDLPPAVEQPAQCAPAADDMIREMFAGAQWVVTLGGDGTILYAAHIVAGMGIPILSVHLGSLGFHTQVEPSRFPLALDAVERGDFLIENRMLLQVDVEPQTPDTPQAVSPQTTVALNDVVVSKSAWGRMVHLRIHVDEKPASDLYADGFLVATPTGSSAYNYAARGPVLEPAMEAIILNAICPHRLNFSPIVLAGYHVVTVEFHPTKPSEEAQLLVDGRPWCSVGHEQRLKIYKAPVYVRLIVFEDRFFEKLREKLAWGGLFWKADA